MVRSLKETAQTYTQQEDDLRVLLEVTLEVAEEEASSK